MGGPAPAMFERFGLKGFAPQLLDDPKPYPKGPGISLGGSGISYGESLGLFGVSETLNFEVPQFIRTLRVNPKPVVSGALRLTASGHC